MSLPGYRTIVLAMLFVVYTINFLDRQILGILVGPIKNELHLTDTQIGLLGGTAFAMVYSLLSVPLALLADRTNRSWVITVSMAVWSAFTALCGMATSFGQLFVFRMGVGIGEAGGLAPSYALLGDYYPPERRARALAIYSLGVPVGLAVGMLLGAYIANAINWRTAFLAVGLAGIVLAPLVKLVVRDPPRPSSRIVRAPITHAFGILAAKPSFWLMAFGASLSSLAGYGLAFWIPSFLERSYGFDIVDRSHFFASLLLIGGCAGVLSGGWIADKLGPRDHGFYAKVPAIAWAITAPLFIVAFWSPSPVLAWFLFLIPQALNILWLGPVSTAVQHLVPSHMRSTATACFMLINNLIGLGTGALLMGAISDFLTPRFGAEALRYSAMTIACLYVLAAMLALLAVRPLRQDWIEEDCEPPADALPVAGVSAGARRST